ncbi:unnamed protein product [Brassicogethes aeneus]|uniref:Uncharacterized protein n=1 Tax=Brassicogethes aeneus TaxID=1431903 RepID=A0A9P0B618_BRAAE|nr:unnamed protein product [Brassicogethes aeneus]
MVVKCFFDKHLCLVKGGDKVIWTKMPSDIVSFAVTTGFGVTVLTGIISGVCYLLAQGINKKRYSRPGQEWYCTNCGTYLRSIEGILEGDRVVTCEKCNTRVCKNRCSSKNLTERWVCNVCSKTPLSWYESVLKIIQPSRVSVNLSAMDRDSLKQFESDLEEMCNKEKAEIRDFIERLVNAMLGDNVDDACVSRLYKDKKYDAVFEKYHQDLSRALTELGCSLQTSIAMIKTLESQLKVFKTHCFVKRVQERYFDEQKVHLAEDEVLVVQIDFAENYSLVSQNEIQSAHWSHKQVTIFTCVVWTPQQTFSIAIISDYMGHDKYAVYVFLQEIFKKIHLNYPHLLQHLCKTVIFSDGCAAQFKNKYTLSNLCYYDVEFNLPSVEWNFFASSHGKGAVDALGGVVKRTVWRERLLRDSNELPSLQKDETNPEVPSEDNNSTYEDLLATAIINKVISSCQNNQNLPSSSANSVSSRQSTSSRTKDDREYFFGEETLDSKWKTTDLDTTSISSLEDWMQNEHNGTKKYVDKVTLTIKQNIEELPPTDSEDDDQDDSEYFKNKSLLSDDDANWFLQKRQFQGTHSPVPVPMLVPDPTGDAKVLIGDKELDETSDLSDIDADFGDTETIPEVKSLLVNSKTIIGGKNSIEQVSIGSDGELSADSGVRDDTKDFDYFGSNNNIDEPMIYAEAVNPSKTDITVDDDNIEDVSITSSYSNTEKDTEYTERYASLPRTIEKSASMSKYDREQRKRAIEKEETLNVQNIQEDENENYPNIEMIGNYTKKEREKWKHAVQMENNPYSKENIEKRLSRSNSSTSSLFGKDYYIKQSSKPGGSKAEAEVSLPKWPRNIENKDQLESEVPKEEEIYTAKPAIVQEEPDEEPIKPKIITERADTSFSEMTSDSDVSFNMYDVATAQVYRKKFKEPEVDEDVDRTSNGDVKRKINKYNDKSKFGSLARWVSTPNISNGSFDTPPTVVRRKKDNTLISKIYMDPNVRKEALTKREYIPDEADRIDTPTFRTQSSLDSTSSPILSSSLTPERKKSIISSTPSTAERKKSVQSLGFKVEENNNFEIQEVQTEMLYSSGDSEDFNKVLERFNSQESINSVDRKKEIDPILDEINHKHLVAERLGKFSKSMPDVGNEKPIPQMNLSREINNNIIEEEELKISVKDLRKRFERDDEPKNFIANSLTARTLGRGTINNLKFN